MATIRQIPKGKPDLNETLNVLQESTMARLNCHNIGKIISFYKDTQTVDVQLMQLKQHQDRIITPPIITNIPLIIYGTNDAYITMPDPVGSTVVLLFMDRNIDDFILTGEMYPPSTGRMHDFTDAIALLTFKTEVDSIQNYDDAALSLKNNNVQIKLYNNNKVDISNSNKKLGNLIKSLIATIKSIATVADESGGTLTPQSQQASQNISDEFEQLLESE